jgi:hypothetical protein
MKSLSFPEADNEGDEGSLSKELEFLHNICLKLLKKLPFIKKRVALKG